MSLQTFYEEVNALWTFSQEYTQCILVRNRECKNTHNSIHKVDSIIYLSSSGDAQFSLQICLQ